MVEEGVEAAAKAGHYTYESSGLEGVGWTAIVFGSLWTCVCLVFIYAMVWVIPRQPGAGAAPLPFLAAFFVVISLFLCIGVGVLSSGLSYIKTANNESVELTPTEIVWTDRNGVECVRVPFNMITRVEETTLSQVQITLGKGSSAPQHHKCTVTTPAGNFVFTDNIDEYEALKQFCISNQTQHVQTGTFRYRNTGRTIGGLIFLILALAVFIGALELYFTGTEMSINGQMQRAPFYLVIFAFIWSSVFGLWGMLLAFVSLNERIVIAGNRLLYYDWFGKKKVDVSLDLVERGSYKKFLMRSSQNSFKYEVQTQQGRVGWSDQMKGCTDLCGTSFKTNVTP